MLLQSCGDLFGFADVNRVPIFFVFPEQKVNAGVVGIRTAGEGGNLISCDLIYTSVPV